MNSALTEDYDFPGQEVLAGGQLNATEVLAHQHARRSAVRALAGLARDADDFALLADMLDLDPADAHTDLPALHLTPALPAPTIPVVKADTRPPGLRFDATPAQQAPARAPRAPRPRASLQAELEQLEREDPAVAAASRSYDETVDRILTTPAAARQQRPAPASQPAPGPLPVCARPGCGKPSRHTGAHRTGETEQVVTKLTPEQRTAMTSWAAYLGQTPSAYIRSLIVADLHCQGRLQEPTS